MCPLAQICYPPPSIASQAPQVRDPCATYSCCVLCHLCSPNFRLAHDSRFLPWFSHLYDRLSPRGSLLLVLFFLSLIKVPRPVLDVFFYRQKFVVSSSCTLSLSAPFVLPKPFPLNPHANAMAWEGRIFAFIAFFLNRGATVIKHQGSRNQDPPWASCHHN